MGSFLSNLFRFETLFFLLFFDLNHFLLFVSGMDFVDCALDGFGDGSG